MDELDHASERIERAALESLHQCCPSAARKNLGLDMVEIDDGVVACSSVDPSILINRTLGLGTERPVGAGTVESVAQTYASRAISSYFLHIYDHTVSDACRRLLDGPRFTKRRGWMKFRALRPEGQAARTALRIERIGVDRSTDFAAIVCGAFGMLDTSIPLLAGLANDDRWHLFVSYDGDRPAGAGALFLSEGAGWLEWGATDPVFRRRGSQASIMAARLNLARELGCEFVFTETGEAVEGDSQHSYKNILKAGFSEALLRANYAPATG